MSLQDQYEAKRNGLEQNIEEANKLINELKQKLAASTNPAEQGRLEVNIEDVTRQVKDWHYELSALTTGKE